jgi:hypothetical protein
MRIVRVLCPVFFGAAVLSVRVAEAQDTREVVIRLHRAGDTISIRGATVTIDHTIEAGNTDSADIGRVPDLLDGGHITQVAARDYQAYFDNFNSGASVELIGLQPDKGFREHWYNGSSGVEFELRLWLTVGGHFAHDVTDKSAEPNSDR